MAKPSIKGTIHVVLRERVAALEKEVRSLHTSLAFHENAHMALERRAKAAEEQAEAFMNACRILASATSNTTFSGRQAREEARRILEAEGIRPPSTLGSSRSRGS